MRFQMGGVDHQLIRLAAFGAQLRQDPVEYPKPAPADEAIIDRLVGTIVFRRVAPAQSIADDEDDPADDTPVIDARHTMRQREICSIRRICASDSNSKSLMATS